MSSPRHPRRRLALVLLTVLALGAVLVVACDDPSTASEEFEVVDDAATAMSDSATSTGDATTTTTDPPTTGPTTTPTGPTDAVDPDVQDTDDAPVIVCEGPPPWCYPGADGGPGCCLDLPSAAWCGPLGYECNGDSAFRASECGRIDATCDAAAAGSVACGGDVCDRAAGEMCLACAHADSGERHAHCVALGDAERFFDAAGLAAQAHGCSFVANVYVECDGPEDCGPTEECVFDGGESGYGWCAEADVYDYGVACETDAECDGEFDVCREIDPFGYFGAHADLTGWMPRGCTDSAGVIACGEAGYCEVGTEVCRWPLFEEPEPPRCEPAPDDGWGTEGWFLHCDGREDCATGACTVMHGGSGSWAVCGDIAGLCHDIDDCPQGANGCEPNVDLPSEDYRQCEF